MPTTRSDVLEIRQKIMDVLAEYIKEHGYAPSNKELQALVGRSKPRLADHLKALAEEGRITIGAGSRAIVIND